MSRQARRERWLINKTDSRKRTFRRLKTGEEAGGVGFQIELGGKKHQRKGSAKGLFPCIAKLERSYSNQTKDAPI